MSRGARDTQETELGEEVKCASCQEFWPKDSEFFFFTNGKPHSYCKACYKIKVTLPRLEKKRRTDPVDENVHGAAVSV